MTDTCRAPAGTAPPADPADGRKSLPEDELAAERRAAVADVVKARMAELRWSVSGLSKLSGLSVTTIKTVIRATRKPQKSTLVTLSAVLQWDPQYLRNVLDGKTPANPTPASALHAQLAKQVTEMRADIAALAQDVRRNNGKADRLIAKIDWLIQLATRRRSG